MPDTTETPPEEHPGGSIEPIEIQEEMEQSFLDYAMSVIVARAPAPTPATASSPSIAGSSGACTTSGPVQTGPP